MQVGLDRGWEQVIPRAELVAQLRGDGCEGVRRAGRFWGRGGGVVHYVVDAVEQAARGEVCEPGEHGGVGRVAAAGEGEVFDDLVDAASGEVVFGYDVAGNTKSAWIQGGGGLF